MKRHVTFAIATLILSAPAHAALSIFACEPEWAALSEVLGGNAVEVYHATNGLQDPHFIQARPSLIAKLRNADLLVCNGASLEVGWLPVLLQRAGNDRVQPGNAGNFEAAQYVEMMDKPAHVDRAMGDLHADGNPHIVTDPRNILLVATALSKRLQELDKPDAAAIQVRYEKFAKDWRAALQRWEASAQSLRGKKIVTQHRSWGYLLRWLGIEDVAELEDKPGIPPSSEHLASVLQIVKKQGVVAVVHSAYQDASPSQWLVNQTGIKEVALPFTVGGDEQAVDLFSLYDDTVRRLKEAL